MDDDRATRLMHTFGFNLGPEAEAFCACGWHAPMPRLAYETAAQLRVNAEHQHFLHVQRCLALSHVSKQKA